MIAIINSGVANIASIEFALQRLRVSTQVTTERKVVENASHVILPGVGAANTAMKNLKDLGLDTLIPRLKQPVLGICLGMQLLFEKTEEGDTSCLGIIPGKITKLPEENNIIPHMGWNTIIFKEGAALTGGLANKSYMYFVHSFAAPICDSTLAETEYGQRFSAVVQKDNFYATQFHPERSGEAGQKLLQNFLELTE
jgi:glutamine amidotransferase